MTKRAIKRVAENIGVVVDPSLEGADKWDTFARLRIEINPVKCLPDRIQIALPRGKIATALLHYERVIRICMFCVKLGHEVEQCEERNCLLSHIKDYPPELHEILFEKLKPTCGAWINKLYLLSRLTPDLNQVPPYTADSGRNYEGLSADIDGDTQEKRYKGAESRQNLRGTKPD
jgi:hypothetical protein